jgi:hypothetical protein
MIMRVKIINRQFFLYYLSSIPGSNDVPFYLFSNIIFEIITTVNGPALYFHLP